MTRRRRLDPMAVVGLSSAYWSARVLHVAHRLDLFTRLERLGPQGASPDRLARACGASRRGIAVLLTAAAALGLVTVRAGRWRTTPLTRQFLVQGSPRYQGGIVAMFDEWYLPWGRLHEAVTTDRPVVEKPHEQSAEAVRTYIMGMHYRAIAQAGLLAAKVPLRGRRRLLDVAGGPGTFAVTLCRRNPGLTAVVLDLPQTLAIARELLAQAGSTGDRDIAQRVTTQAGDYLAGDLGTGYDVVLLSSIFNQESPETVRRLLRKACDALEPGGLMIVQEQMVNRDKTGPLLAALIGVNQLIHTPGGQVYSGREVAGWMRAVGCTRVREVRMPSPSPFTVVTGLKAGLRRQASVVS